MIVLDIDIILVAFVSTPLLITAALALYYTLGSLHRPLRTHESIYECDHCGHTYAIARNRPLDRCPRCGTLNEAVRT